MQTLVQTLVLTVAVTFAAPQLGYGDQPVAVKEDTKSPKKKRPKGLTGTDWKAKKKPPKKKPPPKKKRPKGLAGTDWKAKKKAPPKKPPPKKKALK